LGPWPDLLSKEVLDGGQTVFWLEVIKTSAPYTLGLIAFLVVLQGLRKTTSEKGQHVARSGP
jgi:hypothetical protein